MTIGNSAVKAFESVIDAKIQNHQTSIRRETTHMAEVKRIENDGTIWVHIYGGSQETPARSTTVAVAVGDVVNVVISNGALTITANLTRPSASISYVDNLNQAVSANVTELKNVVAQKASFEQLVAVQGTVGTLAANYANLNEVVAGKADIVYVDAAIANIDVANIDELIAHKADIDYVNAAFAKVDFANVSGAEVGMAKIVELLANSGIFQNLTYNDGVVTGTLTAVEILGDLIRANTVLADRIVYPGSDGMYYMLNYHGGYYEAEPEAGDDPSEEGWYELGQDNAYRLSSDTSVSAGKTYYVLDESKALQMEQAKYAHALDGSRIVAKSITANEISTESLTADTAFVNSLRTLMLLTEAVQIGATGKVHIEMSNNRFSFFEAGYSQPADMSGVSADIPLPGEVAYIAVDEKGNSTFYMTRAVVMKDLRFGNWKWYDRDNGNLALKWMGQTSTQSATS
jgi:hypothetical protein